MKEEKYVLGVGGYGKVVLVLFEGQYKAVKKIRWDSVENLKML